MNEITPRSIDDIHNRTALETIKRAMIILERMVPKATEAEGLLHTIHERQNTPHIYLPLKPILSFALEDRQSTVGALFWQQMQLFHEQYNYGPFRNTINATCTHFQPSERDYGRIHIQFGPVSGFRRGFEDQYIDDFMDLTFRYSSVIHQYGQLPHLMGEKTAYFTNELKLDQQMFFMEKVVDAMRLAGGVELQNPMELPREL